MCGGVSLYAVAKNMNKGVFSSNDVIESSTADATNQIFGLLLVFGNLALDGYTNNEQDKITHDTNDAKKDNKIQTKTKT